MFFRNRNKASSTQKKGNRNVREKNQTYSAVKNDHMKFWIGIFASLCFTLAACGNKMDTNNTESSSEKSTSPATEERRVDLSDDIAQKAGIQMGKPALTKISHLLTLNGTVEVPPQNLVSVSFPMAGFLTQTQLIPGMKVRKGQVIGTMEDQALIQLQQDYLVAFEKWKTQEKIVKRQTELNESKATSDQTLEESSSMQRSLYIEVRALEEKLKLIGLNPSAINAGNISRKVSLKSPIDGFVSKVNVNIGKYVPSGEVLFELVNPDDFHAALTVFEKDIPLVKIGQKVSIKVADQPQITHEATVILITQNVDENRAVVVHCHFNKEDHSLLPGMFLKAEVETDQSEGWKLPNSAVLRYENEEVIFVKSGPHSYEMLPVVVVSRSGAHVNIQQPTLTQQSEIVVKNAYALLSKLKNVEEEE